MAFRAYPDSMENYDMHGPAVSVTSKCGGSLLRLGHLLMRLENLDIVINAVDLKR